MQNGIRYSFLCGNCSKIIQEDLEDRRRLSTGVQNTDFCSESCK